MLHLCANDISRNTEINNEHWHDVKIYGELYPTMQIGLILLGKPIIHFVRYVATPLEILGGTIFYKVCSIRIHLKERRKQF